jgi:hypothetical protein
MGLGKKKLSLRKTSRHNFAFVFVDECERVSLKKKLRGFHVQWCLVMGYEIY